MKKLKNSRAITLVALIITVIVMMILAGATVYMIMNGDNLFDKVREVVERWNLSTKKNQDELARLENKLDGEFSKGQPGIKVNDLLNREGIKVGEKIADGKGGIVPVPEGFYYVGGIIEKGAVISDKPADQNKYKGQENVGKDLQGNQFVFVPVDGETLKYEQDHTYDTNAYANYTDWHEDEATENAESVQTYGGFYIGRYEAGWSDEIKDEIENGQKVQVTNKNDLAKTPISKAGLASWNFVTQNTAKAVSQNMYGAESRVTSKLIDSYAWDTTCKWLKNSGIDLESSAKYGNYSNSKFIVEDAIYSKHIYLTAIAGSGQTSGWYMNKGGIEYYTKGTIQLGKKTNNVALPEGFSDKEYTAEEWIEIATGSSENTKINNIYDLAGNMYEWTTENGNQKKSEGTVSTNTYAVLRGGHFYCNSTNIPVARRYSFFTVVDHLNVYIGFRVVLYIK